MRGRFRDRESLGEVPEPEILPMMNILFMLVMVLMGMSAFLPIGVISIQAPQLSGAGAPVADSRPELNLTIMILKTGFNLSVAGSMLKCEDGPLFPKIQKDSQLVYNFAALRAKLTEIKAQYPQDKRIILMADPNTIYEDITRVMDAARPMFDEVAFVPGMIQ